MVLLSSVIAAGLLISGAVAISGNGRETPAGGTETGLFDQLIGDAPAAEYPAVPAVPNGPARIGDATPSRPSYGGPTDSGGAVAPPAGTTFSDAPAESVPGAVAPNPDTGEGTATGGTGSAARGTGGTAAGTSGNPGGNTGAGTSGGQTSGSAAGNPTGGTTTGGTGSGTPAGNTGVTDPAPAADAPAQDGGGGPVTDLVGGLSTTVGGLLGG